MSSSNSLSHFICARTIFSKHETREYPFFETPGKEIIHLAPPRHFEWLGSLLVPSFLAFLMILEGFHVLGKFCYAPTRCDEGSADILGVSIDFISFNSV